MKVKSLKELKMPNCGLSALSQITELKNISAFTLVHAARDNGLTLHVFKVNDLKDLIKVQRPCIFHQTDHFVFSKNGEPMPSGEYSGFVIGPAVLGRVIGLSEAKFIRGGKNFLTGKNSDGEQTGHGALGDILAVVASAVTLNPLVGAAVSAGYGAMERAQNQDELGSPWDPKGLAIDAVRGVAEGAGAHALASGLSSLGQAGGAASGSTQAAFQQAVSGSVGSGLGTGGGTGLATIGQSVGSTGLAGASNAFGNAVSNAVGSGIGAGSTPAFSPSAFNPAFKLSSVPFTNAVSNSVGQGVSSAGGASTVAPTATATAGGGLLKTLGNGITNSITKSITDNPVGSAASLAGAAGVFGSKPPAYTAPSPASNYSAVQTYLGSTPQGQANGTFGLAATNQNTDYVNSSIQDLQKQFTGNNQRTLDTINTAYDNQRQQLSHQYAQSGQNFANSSELQDKVGQLEQKRTNDLTLAQQELTDQALGQAIQVKQQALSQGMQAGQWNQTLAFQLASLTGDQQTLQYAIAHDDYKTFQEIMGKLMTMGIPQSTTGSSSGGGININLGRT